MRIGFSTALLASGLLCLARAQPAPTADDLQNNPLAALAFIAAMTAMTCYNRLQFGFFSRPRQQPATTATTQAPCRTCTR